MFALTEPLGTPPPGPYILSLLTPPPFSRTEILPETPWGEERAPPTMTRFLTILPGHLV